MWCMCVLHSSNIVTDRTGETDRMRKTDRTTKKGQLHRSMDTCIEEGRVGQARIRSGFAMQGPPSLNKFTQLLTFSLLTAEQRIGALLSLVFSPKQCSELAALAAAMGKLGCLDILRLWGCSMNHLVWAAAGAQGRRLDVLRWLHEFCLGQCGQAVTTSAAIAGHLDCLSFLHSIGATCSVFFSGYF
jgi:hypothetical protein